MKLKVNQINHSLIKEKTFTIALCNWNEMFSTHNKFNSVVAEWFIKTLKA